MSLVKSLKTFIDTMLTGTSYASVDIAFGQRPQGSNLQFITYSITSDKPAAIGGGMSFATVEIDFMSENAETAMDMAEEFTDNLTNNGTYDSIVYHAIVDQHFLMQDPTIGASEEAQPHTCTVSLDIYYERA